MATAVLLLLAVVICVAVFLAPTRASDIWTEIAKACIQLLVVVGLGGVVGTVLRSVDQRRDERRARDEQRYAIFQQTVDAYHRLKYVRRYFRSMGLRAPAPQPLSSKQLTALRDGMTDVIQVELTLEDIYRGLDARPVFDRTKDIRHQLDRLLKYVSGLVKEWEKSGAALCKNSQAVHVDNLPRLQAFLAPAPVSFTAGAADPMGWIEWIVRDELSSTRHTRRSRVEAKKQGPAAEFDAERDDSQSPANG
ncbi:hypothetical protein GGC64_005979 [Mycobacterium sp. OAS707]|uniref:hypothetical protein n=1 Tax=Mycobacterium sp. OAS707 TaxID=2663822 RepID=UPI00178B0C80|nr:hypothetical protein [Mycobacterium sp. OAS707]MBE1551892.1 hypothetical protein [Mycobacterium sp. OAS707]